MITIKNPEQNQLFDYYETIFSEVAYKRLKTSYHSVFRCIILSLMPVKEIGANFHEILGRPTKELYSMAGLLLLKEFHNWTTAQATDSYLFDMRVQYALNLGHDKISFCDRTLERYMKLLLDDDQIAVKIFDDVTAKLIEELDLKVDQQRLDSTHVFSDMATFSRTKLMGITIKRFLIQLVRHHTDLYNQLPESLRKRYEKRENALFADVSKDKEKRGNLRQDVAEQMHLIIQYFTSNEAIEKMTTFKKLVTVFTQQCEVLDCIEIEARQAKEDKKVAKKKPKNDNSSKDDEKNDGESDDSKKSQEDNLSDDGEKNEGENDLQVVVRKKTGGDVIQNPSDTEATYDGHKGPGYQAQIAETSNPENEVQLVTGVLPQTAVESDAKAVEPVFAKLNEQGFLPQSMLADSLYGSDENVLFSTKLGVELIAPVSGGKPKTKPKEPTEKQLRLAKRREEQDTPEWRKRFNPRAQIEGTIGSVKRRTQMVRLRFRGQKSVFCSIYLKLAGWNISRAACSCRIQKKVARIIEKAKQTPSKSRISLSALLYYESERIFTIA